MIAARPLVIDTNVLVSGMLFPASIPSLALLRAQENQLLVSKATKLELIEVMRRSRFDRFVERSIREGLVAEYLRVCRIIEIDFPIRACRDPRDDKFLEVAVHGRADVILTGDADLLALHPFQGIAILTPAEFLQTG